MPIWWKCLSTLCLSLSLVSFCWFFFPFSYLGCANAGYACVVLENVWCSAFFSVFSLDAVYIHWTRFHQLQIICLAAYQPCINTFRIALCKRLQSFTLTHKHTQRKRETGGFRWKTNYTSLLVLILHQNRTAIETLSDNIHIKLEWAEYFPNCLELSPWNKVNFMTVHMCVRVCIRDTVPLHVSRFLWKWNIFLVILLIYGAMVFGVILQ